MKLCLSILIVCALNSFAFACGSCGFVGNSCRFVRVHPKPVIVQQKKIVPVVQPIVKEVVVPATQTTTVNVYPAPLAAQGKTVYGLSNLVTYNQVNAADVYAEAARLARTSQELSGSAYQQFSTLSAQMIGGQIELAKIQAAGNALSGTLKASASAATSPLSFRVEMKDGKLTLQKIEEAKGGEPDKPDLGSQSILKTRCAKCHTGATPKGDLLLEGQPLSADVITEALRQVASNKMPKDGPLTDAEKGKVFEELLSLESE